jgi:hypothetical protein
MQKKSLKYSYIFIGLCALFSFSLSASAYVRSSSNFRIQSDTINSGGTDESTSNSYKAWDSIGEVGTGISSSTNYNIGAGYRQMEDNYISLTLSTSTIYLTPVISGLMGGTATGSATWTVTTDSIPGYHLDIRATSSPAMRSGSEIFADYTPATAGTPDFNWNLAGANSEFGFSPYNFLNESPKYKNDGAGCNNGGPANTDEKCWSGLTTSDQQAVYRTSRTDPGGENVKMNFRAEVKQSGGYQIGGDYSAGIVITAVAN